MNRRIEEGISIITIALNDKKNIEGTILSVINQKVENLQYIVIDGGSTDGTLEVIQKYRSRISILESGDDGGIYQAINKGISYCNNSLVGTIHCGDRYAKDSLAKVYSTFKDTNADILYGDLVVQEEIEDDFSFRKLRANHKLLRKRMSVFHPATFIKLSIYINFGAYDCFYRSAADYDLLLKLYILGYKFVHIPVPLAIFSSGGISSMNFQLSLKENFHIRKSNLGIFHAGHYGLSAVATHLFFNCRRQLAILILGKGNFYKAKRRLTNKNIRKDLYD